ncbi:reverse transcriptase domain-containing protein [Actinomadura sp. CNU-125]|uniref:reverse transcriptase domain-containing protein n=1 Tax=Actinomadura sp. CNU-125 TaxID=1904961 RepID=UPI00096A837D|nr:reverse transcriptase domain-containing protein [Actinomadura sp. CNU-125]
MASEPVLWNAWSRVAAGSGMPGADGVSATAFGREVGPRLAALSRLLLEGRYQAQPLRPIPASRGGRARVRAVPTICDRVVQRAFLNVCGGRLLGRSSVSFSYRKGRSWLNAVEQVRAYRNSGLHWVLRTDIADFFAEIDHGLLLTRLRERFRESALVDLVADWISAPLLTPEGIAERARDLPEGAPVSPALAEFFLTGFDRSVDHGHGRLIRYADDLAVLCPTLDDAMAALGTIESALTDRGLRINHEKTSISDFEHGFTLLGWQFTGQDVQPLGTEGH